MKRYRFRLEGVARVRQLQEDQAKGALAAANAAVTSADATLSAQQQRYAAGAAVPTGGEQGIDAFLRQRTLRTHAAATVVAAAQAKQAAEIEADAKREAWSKAAQEVQVLKRLDDRRRAEHDLEAERATAVEVDDLVVSRFKVAAP